MLPLTHKQEQLWRYLATCRRSPTFSEMMGELGLASKSGVYKLLNSLEERGFIRRIRNRPRAIELIEQPSLSLGLGNAELASFSTVELREELRRREATGERQWQPKVRAGTDALCQAIGRAQVQP